MGALDAFLSGSGDTRLSEKRTGVVPELVGSRPLGRPTRIPVSLTRSQSLTLTGK